MSSRQNKPQTARDRLAQISHHFLSDDDVSDEAGVVEEVSDEVEDVTDEIVEHMNDVAEDIAEQAIVNKKAIKKEDEPALENSVYTLAVLKTAKDDDDLPVYLLSQQLAESGRSSAILDCATGNMVSFMNDAQQTRTVHHGLDHNTLADAARRLGNKPHDVHFLLVDTPESSCLPLVNRVLVTAPATPEGLERTYTSIKQLAANLDTPQVGVTITGTRDATLAEDYYNRLATAAHRFLDHELRSYGYLPATSGTSWQTTSPHPVLTSLTRSSINIIAEFISDEISEWQNSIRDDDQQKPQAVDPAAANQAASLQLKSVAITSDDDLLQLVTDALPDILGNAYELVNDDLPLDSNQLLALNAQKQAFVISFDNNDGTHALQSGLSALENLSKNRAKIQRLNTMIQRLHPDLFNSNERSPFRIEDTHLIVLSPRPPTGGGYLTHTLNYLSFYTFSALRINDRTGLFIEPCFTHEDSAIRHRDPNSDKISHAFRGGKTVLSQEETAFFQDTYTE